VLDKFQCREFAQFIEDTNSLYSGIFTKIMKTEVGKVLHSLRIISGVPQAKQIRRGTYRYTFTVMSYGLSFDTNTDTETPPGFPGGLPGSFDPKPTEWIQSTPNAGFDNYSDSLNLTGSSSRYAYVFNLDTQSAEYLQVTSTSDHGETWSKLANQPQFDNQEASGAGQGAIACSKDGSVIVACVGGSQKFISSNFGQSWIQIEDQTVNGFTVYDIAISGNGSSIFFASYTDNFLSIDGGETWERLIENLNSGSPGAPSVSRRCVMSASGNTIVVGFADGYGAISRDGGISWFPIPRYFGCNIEESTEVSRFSIEDLSISDDGSKIYAVTFQFFMSYSNDNGYSWNNIDRGALTGFGNEDGSLYYTDNSNRVQCSKDGSFAIFARPGEPENETINNGGACYIFDTTNGGVKIEPRGLVGNPIYYRDVELVRTGVSRFFVSGENGPTAYGRE
jgi:photosystem II stability/assembly factor-like uncharacterized protein